MLMPLYLGLSLAASGCELFTAEKSTPADTLLQAARMSPDSVAMEVFFIRLPHDDRQTYDEIWREVDETPLDPALRRRLSENGLRAGVVAAQLPTPLQAILQRYKIDEPRQEAAQPTEGLQQANTVKLDKEPAVSMRRLQLGSGRRGEVIASGLKPRAEVLIKEETLSAAGPSTNAKGCSPSRRSPCKTAGHALRLCRNCTTASRSSGSPVPTACGGWKRHAPAKYSTSLCSMSRWRPARWC
jgi:hypothetical protein